MLTATSQSGSQGRSELTTLSLVPNGEGPSIGSPRTSARAVRAWTLAGAVVGLSLALWAVVLYTILATVRWLLSI